MILSELVYRGITQTTDNHCNMQSSLPIVNNVLANVNTRYDFVYDFHYLVCTQITYSVKAAWKSADSRNNNWFFE